MDKGKKCRETLNDPIIVCKEHNRKISFLNTQRGEVTKILVDGCEINDKGVRCDYLVIKDQVERYVELKGSNINHAIKQLKRSINLLSVNPKSSKKESFIISSRCPKSSAAILELKLKFRKEFNSSLLVKNNAYRHKI